MKTNTEGAYSTDERQSKVPCCQVLLCVQGLPIVHALGAKVAESHIEHASHNRKVPILIHPHVGRSPIKICFLLGLVTERGSSMSIHS